MSKNEFNWFNVRTSGEELGDDEWEVVEGKSLNINLTFVTTMREELGDDELGWI